MPPYYGIGKLRSGPVPCLTQKPAPVIGPQFESHVIRLCIDSRIAFTLRGTCRAFLNPCNTFRELLYDHETSRSGSH